jgi:Uri superfamily endonuclease
VFKILEQSNPKITNNRLLHRKVGTYTLILHCRHERSIDTGKLGKMSVRKGCYVYIGSAFGSGGLLARIKHHCRISKSPHWHIDYLRPAVEITEVWYSHDPIKREHEWASILMGVHGVKLPLRGFGSTDCKCDSHLFFFITPPSVKMFRTRIEQAIPNHHRIEWIDGTALSNMN